VGGWLAAGVAVELGWMGESGWVDIDWGVAVGVPATVGEAVAGVVVGGGDDGAGPAESPDGAQAIRRATADAATTSHHRTCGWFFTISVLAAPAENVY
jgi:hypothetical protein